MGSCQRQLFCPLIQLIDKGIKVATPENVVYSTDPHRANGLDGKVYFVKGPELEIVIAEVVAHLLARDLQLRVPDFGVVLSAEDAPLFASCEVPHCHRTVDDWIVRRRITNHDLLPRLVVFDIWVANKDRNIGNLVGAEVQTGTDVKIALVAIDFEKSVAIRGPYPLTTVDTIPVRQLWPSGILGDLVQGVPCPGDFCETIEHVSESQIEAAFASIESRLGTEVPWKESSVSVLMKRAKKIRKLVAEVWR